MLYLMTHSTPFKKKQLRLYGVGHMINDHFIGESANPLPPQELTTRVLLCVTSHRQNNIYHGLWYTSRGPLYYIGDLFFFTVLATWSGT